MSAQADRVRGDAVLGLALSSPDIRALPMLKQQADPIDFLKGHLHIESAGSSGELRVSLTSTAPDDARAIVDAVLSAAVQSAAAQQLQSTTQAARHDNLDGSPVADAAGFPDERDLLGPGPAGASEAGFSQGSAVATATAQAAPIAVSILQPAQTLGVAVWPLPGPVLGIAAIFGLVLGLVLALASDLLSVRPRHPLDASAAARAPLLGRVPTLPSELDSAALRGQSVLIGVAASAATAWRQLAGSLDGSFVSNFDKTILFTAAGGAHGKSLLASNLAISMAQAGHRVVLVDGHPDRPAVGPVYAADGTTGLADAIEGRVKLADALKVTGLHGLEVLPLGNPSGQWKDILNSQRFIDVLNELCDRFDRVLIDGGPSASAECRIIGAYCDLAVLVADAGSGSRRDLRDAADGIRVLGARLAGVVWNRPPRGEASLGQYGGGRVQDGSSATAPAPTPTIAADIPERTSPAETPLETATDANAINSDRPLSAGSSEVEAASAAGSAKEGVASAV
jgi:receptor protein-tyrosine kinase